MNGQKPPRDPFGHRLRVLRVQRGMGQEELAGHLGVHSSLISLYESGARRPRLGTLARLAEALGTTSAKLLDEPPPNGAPVPPKTIDRMTAHELVATRSLFAGFIEQIDTRLRELDGRALAGAPSLRLEGQKP